MSLFDDPRFNRSLFFPRADDTPPPPGARDAFVDVDGARLQLRVHEGDGRGLLLFHGNGEVVADYDAAAAAFATIGLRLLVADFRGYGRSTGTPTLRTTLADTHALFAAAVRAVGAPLFVMGRSLGGNCAIELAQTARAEVLGYVFESTATDLEALLARRGITGARLDEADRATFDPLRKIARCSQPALFLHGAEDTLIVPEEARRGHATVAGSRLVLITGRGHNDVSLSPDYWEALRSFTADAGRR